MQTTTSDDLRWKLAGIRAEQTSIQERLKYLQDEERRLTGQGLIGAHKASSKAAKAGPKSATRKRAISPEQRKKMSESAKLRWAQRKQATGQVPPPMEATA